jgi:hypothetical protein
VTSSSPTFGRQALIEILLIFAIFAIQGARPVPDVNEPYYLGKAIHYWNPDWLRGDFFMESADTHKVFYFTVGWLSLGMSPVALAWTGRIVTWLLLAWAWRRLSVAVVQRPWFSILSAALFACLMDRCHMAGEWVIGGVEAKGFAYVLVLLGIESLVRNRWNRALAMLGAASAFHVLVGGWSIVATAVAWFWLGKERPALRSLWPGIIGGFLLALPGLVAVLGLDWGVDRETVRQAHQIYVFDRLPHHLTLTGIKWYFILRLVLLGFFWLALARLWPGKKATRRLRAFVTGAIAIALVGVAIEPLIWIDYGLAADLLRYYWFRLTDFALPLGVALEVCAIASAALGHRPTFGRRWLAAALLVAVVHVADRGIDRIVPLPPMSYGAIGRVGLPPTREERFADFDRWHEACQWVADPNNVAPGARFLTPRLGQTFKWYSGHPSVVDWKDVPQDAGSLVEWWHRMEEIYSTGLRSPDPRWHESLAELGADRLKELGEKYHADYVLTPCTDPPLPLEVVYDNHTYIIYRLR